MKQIAVLLWCEFFATILLHIGQEGTFNLQKMHQYFWANFSNPGIMFKITYEDTVSNESSFAYVMIYKIIKRDIPHTNTGYKLNIY